jgi:hypothetical protein
MSDPVPVDVPLYSPDDGSTAPATTRPAAAQWPADDVDGARSTMVTSIRTDTDTTKDTVDSDCTVTRLHGRTLCTSPHTRDTMAALVREVDEAFATAACGATKRRAMLAAQDRPPPLQTPHRSTTPDPQHVPDASRFKHTDDGGCRGSWPWYTLNGGVDTLALDDPAPTANDSLNPDPNTLTSMLRLANVTTPPTDTAVKLLLLLLPLPVDVKPRAVDSDLPPLTSLPLPCANNVTDTSVL